MNTIKSTLCLLQALIIRGGYTFPNDPPMKCLLLIHFTKRGIQLRRDMPRQKIRYLTSCNLEFLQLLYYVKHGNKKQLRLRHRRR
jgi:hypothetical protein